MHVSQIKKRARESKVKTAGYNFVTYDYLAPAGHTLDDLLTYGYWVDIARTMKIGDEIKVVCEDLSYCIRLFVLNKEDNVGVKVCVLENYDLSMKQQNTERLPLQSDGYEIKWRAARKWSIINPDGNIVREDLDSQDEAKKELQSYLKALAA